MITALKEIGVHKSTIIRELNKNITFVRTALGSWQYKPDYAQNYAEQRPIRSLNYATPNETFIANQTEGI